MFRLIFQAQFLMIVLKMVKVWWYELRYVIAQTIHEIQFHIHNFAYSFFGL